MLATARRITTLYRASAKSSSRLLVSMLTCSSSYEDAIDRLMELQNISSVVRNAELRAKQGKGQADKLRNDNVRVTNVYLKRLGITSEDLKKLNVIHVAGTKGKGSTCALTESILRHSGYSTGFSSSPHLMEVRERIRLNGKVISRDLFAKYFFEIWDQFKRMELTEDPSLPPRYPSFIKYIVVMSYYVFIKEQVDVAVVEVGLGGRFDCTNVIQDPTVTAVTHLGYDHTSILGNSIEEIAWEKAGIMKNKTPVFVVPQVYPAAWGVLEEEAAKKSTQITRVPPLSDYPNPPSGTPSETWSDNISLALQLSKTWLDAHPSDGARAVNHGARAVNHGARAVRGAPVSDGCGTAKSFTIPDAFLRGIERCQWPGRNHVIYRKTVSFFLDGAHTPVSIAKCTEWFKSQSTGSRKKILIANTTRDRQIATFLKIINEAIHLDQIIFCPNIASNLYTVKDCEWPENVKAGMIRTAHENREIWSEEYPSVPALSFSSVAEAVESVESSGVEADVLITGSLHLIGAALQVLDPGYLEDSSRSLTKQYSSK